MGDLGPAEEGLVGVGEEDVGALVERPDTGERRQSHGGEDDGHLGGPGL